MGSTCIENIDPRVGKVIDYFQHILCRPIQGMFVGDLYGLQTFTVHLNTVLVRGTDTIVKHLNPQVFKTLDGQWHVLVKYPQPKTKYVQGQLTFTVL